MPGGGPTGRGMLAVENSEKRKGKELRNQTYQEEGLVEEEYLVVVQQGEECPEECL